MSTKATTELRLNDAGKPIRYHLENYHCGRSTSGDVEVVTLALIGQIDCRSCLMKIAQGVNERLCVEDGE